MTEKYAFLFGNSTYRDARLNKLNAPEADIQALSAALKDPAIAGFAAVRWAVNSTLAAVQTSLVAFLSERKRDDTVLVYFTGHGLLDEDNQLYLALSESDVEHPDINSLSGEWLRKCMDRCRSERQILILDCCYSGAYLEGRKSPADAIAVNNDTFDRQGYGRYVLVASSRTQSAIEAAGASLYTKALVDCLTSGSAAPSKPDVSVADLEEYLSAKFATASAPMRPESTAIQKVGELIIAKNPNFMPPVDARLRAKLVDANEDIRRAAVADLEWAARSAKIEAPRLKIRELLQHHISPDNPQRERSVPVFEAVERAIASIDDTLAPLKKDIAAPPRERADNARIEASPVGPALTVSGRKAGLFVPRALSIVGAIIVILAVAIVTGNVDLKSWLVKFGIFPFEQTLSKDEVTAPDPSNISARFSVCVGDDPQRCVGDYNISCSESIEKWAERTCNIYYKGQPKITHVSDIQGGRCGYTIYDVSCGTQ